MITEYDLQEAIAECEGQRNPSANTCLKLAAFYIIKDKLFPAKQEVEMMHPQYSYAMSTEIEEPKTEFLQMIDGKNPADYLDVMDELMTTVKALIPKLYDGVMRRLSEIN